MMKTNPQNIVVTFLVVTGIVLVVWKIMDSNRKVIE